MKDCTFPPYPESMLNIIQLEVYYNGEEAHRRRGESRKGKVG